ncbi:ABC transporter substrate-binding protein [Sphingomonas baiyangensis]|uniref:ABC transporter substrate-binding protein n=1 Tax=Sphingomonas baiyangensis TaxID=2572576 RepID=A0A4V5PUB7_9SPHN|nr:ABC transporter substrate-binding protein [Sphingomonas baiyangensis]TKD53288.1 ABC transporter substrate-binding protein [Sphingomonas baiyangensis]
MRWPAILLALLVAGCDVAPPPPAPARAMRIVSLDYCADQYLLKFADRARIAALSPDATRDFSYMRAAARGLPQVAARAEDVLVLRPDLVIRSYGGGPGAEAFFASAGVPVLQLGYAGDLAAVRQAAIDVAAQLGEPARGQALASQIDTRLAALPATTRTEALYLTPGGVTAGEGTLIAAMFDAAGLANFQREPGWHPLPLERLAYEAPDMIAAADFNDNQPHRWSAARHPVAQRQMADRPVVPIEGASTACGGWFVLDAIEALAEGAAR